MTKNVAYSPVYSYNRALFRVRVAVKFYAKRKKRRWLLEIMKHKNSDYSSKKDRYYRGFKQLILFDLIVLKDQILLLHLKLVSQASISSSEMQFSKDSFLFCTVREHIWNANTLQTSLGWITLSSTAKGKYLQLLSRVRCIPPIS